MEVLIAFFILLTSLWALSNLSSGAHRANVLATDMTVATQLARGALEKWRQDDLATLVSQPEVAVSALSLQGGGELRKTFLRRLDVAPALSGAAKLLTVTVH